MRKNEVTIKRRNSLYISPFETLIQCKEEHQDPLKLYVPLGRGRRRSFL